MIKSPNLHLNLRYKFIDITTEIYYASLRVLENVFCQIDGISDNQETCLKANGYASTGSFIFELG